MHWFDIMKIKVVDPNCFTMPISQNWGGRKGQMMEVGCDANPTKKFPTCFILFLTWSYWVAKTFNRQQIQWQYQNFLTFTCMPHSSHCFTFRSPVEKETFMLSSLQEIFCVNCPEQCQEFCIWLTGCVRTMIILCVCVWFFFLRRKVYTCYLCSSDPPTWIQSFSEMGSLQALGFLSDRCLIA